MIRATTAIAILLAGSCFLAGAGRATGHRSYRVAYVTTSGDVPTTRTLGGELLLGFLHAEKSLSIAGKIDYVSPTQDPVGELTTLARQHYDLIVTGFPDPAPVDQVARAFPAQRFLMVDIPFSALDHHPHNVEGSVFRAEEAGYLAGYLAALVEDRTSGPHAISAVGGVRFPPVDRWIVGYRAGAHHADPKLEVRVDYSTDFVDPTKCKRIAAVQIAKGSGVVFNVAGDCGLGALDAAKAKGVWGIGVDVDQSFLGKHILTSALLHLEKGMYASIDRFVHGSLPTGGNTLFDLKSGGVGLGRISPAVPKAILRRLETVRRQLLAHKLLVPHVT